jgi:hypothetical protein
MKVEQISLFLENKPGTIVNATKVLSDAKINIRALSLADTSDFGILRLIVNDVDTAKTILQNNGFIVRKTEVLAVEVPDTPGGLNAILAALTENDVNVEYMYAYVERSGENAIIIIRCDPIDLGITSLQKKGFTVLPGDKVYNM